MGDPAAHDTAPVPDTRFEVLGPLTVRHNGTELPIPPAKPQVLLATLLLHAGELLSAERLTDLIWDGEPPATARTALHNYVMRLRHALGPCLASRVRTQSSSYLIEVGQGELDLHEFTELRERGRDELRRADWDRAAATLRQALALWTGEPLTGLAAPALRSVELPGLMESALQALEWRIESDLRRGLHSDLVAELLTLTAAHPLRERFHAQLILALYRSGNRTGALGAFAAARRVIVAELGVEPGRELQDLHARILAAPEPEPAPKPAEAPKAPDEQLPVIPRQLPAAAVNFAGRTAELRALTRRLDEAAGREDGVMITVIAGSAGVGKTALAVQWAHRVAARFPDGQLYVNLRGFDPSGTPVTPAEAIRGFLTALQVPAGQIPAGLAAQAALYRSLLAGKQLLVVLDNARGAGQVRPLLPGSPGCPVLVTSRSPLLALAAGEGAYTFTLDLLDDAEATELLARRLGADRVAAEQSAVSELTSLCARLPLALAIAAARAAARPAFPLAAIAAGLADARSRLDVLEAEDAPDATSVRAVFSWSYRILSAPAARMFRLLGVHPGPDISAAAAAALAGLPARAARQALAELTAAQLIAEQVPGRYAFHDLLRAYAEEQALAADDEAARRAAVHRVLDHYLHTGYAAAVLLRPDRERITLDPPLPGTTPERFASYPQALGWLDAERKTLHAATALAAAHGLDAYAWRIPWTLATFSETTGYPEDWSATHEIALAAARRLGDPAGQAYTYRRVGLACLVLGTLDEAQAHLERALDLMRQLGNRRGEAAIHLDLGKVADRQERYRDALEHSRRCADLCQQMGHRVGQADALNAVAWCSVQLGEYDQAVTDCQQAIALQRELGDRRGEAASLDTLGYAYHHLGRYAEAADRYRDALAVLIALGDRLHQAEALTHLGDACHAHGDQAAAVAAWRQALVLLDELDQPSAREVRAKLAGPRAVSAHLHPDR